MNSKPAIIANPQAGQKAGLKTNQSGPDDLQDILQRHGVEAELLLTERPNHATELARQAVEDSRPLVAAAGGDGTVAEVAAGLVGSDTKLGVLPLGSIMNLARMLGVPRDLDAAAEVIRAGHSVRIDAGRATTKLGERVFLEGAGVGVSAALFMFTNQLDARNWKSLGPLLRYLFRYRPRRVRLTVDGQSRQIRATMVTVANGPLLGAAFEMAPSARLDDRQFTVRVFNTWSKRQLAFQIWAILRRKASRGTGMRTYHGRVVEIVGRRPLTVHADSQPLGTTPARFEILPAALSVIVPEQPDPACQPALLQLARA
jgi:diacylglycerol kinase (ATP)